MERREFLIVEKTGDLGSVIQVKQSWLGVVDCMSDCRRVLKSWEDGVVQVGQFVYGSRAVGVKGVRILVGSSVE
jgi:hypothetical protein